MTKFSDLRVESNAGVGICLDSCAAVECAPVCAVTGRDEEARYDGMPI